MDNDVSLHAMHLNSWPALILLGAFVGLFFPFRRDALFGRDPGETIAPAQRRSRRDIARLFLLAALLLGVVFLIPDAGQLQHRSFFSVARESSWTQPFDWPAIWCSAKIIVLSVAVLLVLEAILALMMRAEYPAVCMALLALSVVPTLLGFFGFYELVKAVL